MLPNLQSYNFTYDPTTGLLTKITYPSGGYVSYVWGLNQESAGFSAIIPPTTNNPAEFCPTLVDQPAVVQRNVSFDGMTIALTQTFSYNSGDIGATGDFACALGPYTTTVTTTDNVTGLKYATVYRYNGTWSSLPNESTPVCIQYFPGTEQSIKHYGSTNTGGTPLLSVSKAWVGSNVLTCEMDTLDNGEISGVFDEYTNITSTGSSPIQLLTQKNEYDYGLLTGSCATNGYGGPTGTTPSRETAISYQSFGAQPLFYYPYSNMATLLDRPSSVITYGNVNGTLTPVADSSYLYDQTSVASASAIDHDETNYSSSSSAPRGNATTKTTYCFQGCQSPTTKYTYDETGQIVSLKDPCGNATCSDVTGSNHTTTYAYSDDFTIGTPPGNTNAYLIAISNPLAQTHTFGYSYGTGELTLATDENIQQTQYTYGDPFFARLTTVSYPDGGQGQTTYSYNDSPYSSTTPSPSVTTSRQITSGTNAVTIAAADGMGHMVQTQLASDPAGIDYAFTTYDGLGRKHSVTNPYRTTSDSTYGTTTYTYDALGRATLVTEADGSMIQTSYCGPSTLVTDEAGHWRRSLSDGLGRLVEVDEPNSSTATVTACPNSGDPIVATKYSYDALNNLLGVVQGGSRQRTFVYDSLSRLLASCNPESCSDTGTVSIPATTATGTVTISLGGCTGDKVFVTVNAVETIAFITVSWTPAEIASATASAINNNSSAATYVTATTSGGPAVTLTSNVTGSAGDYAFSASTNGNSCATASGSTLVQGTSTAPGGSTIYAYDANSNLVTKTAPSPNQPPNGTPTVTTTYTYDVLNRLTGKSYADGNPSNTPTPSVVYGYDGAQCTTAPGLADNYPQGRRTSMCDESGGTSWAHDQMGRVLQSSRTIETVQGKFVKYTYNLDGSVASSTTSPLKTISYTYNAAEQMTAAKDNGDGITFVDGGNYAPFGGLATMYYSDYRPSTGVSYAPGIKIGQNYNNRLQISQIYATCESTPGCPTQPNESVMNRTYNLNLGNGTSGSDNGNIISITNGLVSARSQNFTYDWLNRITAAYSTGTNWGETYTIDTWGNLTNIGPYPGKTPLGNLNCAGGNAKNQLSTCFGYDAAGNMTSNGFNTYTYDAENRLIVANGVFYFYDGDGNRVAKCDVGTCQVGSTGTFYWRGVDGNTLVESDVAGSFQYEYIFFDGRRVARRSLTGSEPIYYYFSDHLGTHSIVTDGYGDVENESDFSPYGEEIFITDTLSPQNYKFTGKERDAESGLDYFGFRHYAPSLGRFMKPDEPFADQDEANPQSWNLYSYVRNNPLRYIDPTGNACVSDGNGGWRDDNSGGETCAQVNAANQNAQPSVTVTATAPPNVALAAGAATLELGWEGGPPDWAVGLGLLGLGCVQTHCWTPIINLFSQTGNNSPPPATSPSTSQTATPNPDNGGGRKWKFGSNKSEQQWRSNLARRGWTPEQIDEAVANGQKFPAQNNINPSNGATRYVNPTTGRSVVLDNVTNEVIHVGGDGFRY